MRKRSRKWSGHGRKALLPLAVASLGLAPAGGQLVEYQGPFPVGLALGRVIGDPARPKVYGLSTAGHVVFMDLETRGIERFYATQRKLTDLDVDASGTRLYAVDNITGSPTDQPVDSYILVYDLETQTLIDELYVPAPLYQLALGPQGRAVGLQWSQPQAGAAYLVDLETGAVIQTVPNFVWYWGGRGWAGFPDHFAITNDGSRAYVYDVGLSAPSLRPAAVDSESLTPLPGFPIGISGDLNYNWFMPCAMNTSGTRLYADNRTRDPYNPERVYVINPFEWVWTASGDNRLAFGAFNVYDAPTGTPLEAIPLPFATDQIALSHFDTYLSAFDWGLRQMHVMKVSSPVDPGDADADRDVDADDWLALEGCLTDPGAAPGFAGAPCRLAFDRDGDTDVDARDALRFQRDFTGRLAGYSNTAQGFQYFAPGTFVQAADDLTFAGGDCQLSQYSVSVFGGGGGPFRVVARLHNGCPGNGGTLIPGTTTIWNNVPDDEVYTLQSATLDVPLPETTWIEVSFSTAEAGWLVVGPAEKGATADAFALFEDGAWGCYYWFGGSPLAGLAANVTCDENGRAGAGAPSVTATGLKAPLAPLVAFPHDPPVEALLIDEQRLAE